MSETTVEQAAPAERNGKPPSRRPFRFSLLTLLLVVAIVALFISHWRTSSRLSSAMIELKQLRSEVGHLTIEDPDKIHAIAFKSLEEKTWKWRVYVPAGLQASLDYALNEIPDVGIPVRRGRTFYRVNLPPGESIVTAAFRKNSNEWQLIVGHQPILEGPGSFVRNGLNEKESNWLESIHVMTWIGVTDSTMQLNRPGPLTLLRLRAQRTTGTDRGSTPSKAKDHTSDGLMVWIEENTPESLDGEFGRSE